jgi:hypothetical protein
MLKRNCVQLKTGHQRPVLDLLGTRDTGHCTRKRDSPVQNGTVGNPTYNVPER